MRDATRDAVAFQRDLHDREEEEAQMIIREAGGEIVSLTPEAREAFAAAISPIHAEARERYPRELLQMVGLD